MLGAGHAEGAAGEGHVVELGGDVDARAAAPGAVGVAGLGHEAVHHPVEDEAVVEALAGQLLDARDVLRGLVGEQLDQDLAVLQFHYQGVFGVALGLRRGLAGHKSSNHNHEAEYQSFHRSLRSFCLSGAVLSAGEASGAPPQE